MKDFKQDWCKQCSGDEDRLRLSYTVLNHLIPTLFHLSFPTQVKMVMLLIIDMCGQNKRCG